MQKVANHAKKWESGVSKVLFTRSGIVMSKYSEAHPLNLPRPEICFRRKENLFDK
jgi:hypothetical protein